MPAERLYYNNSFLRAFAARVTATREISLGAWDVALDRTAFYPTSGGQPYDTGRLGQAAISAVAEDDAGEIWHTVDQPLANGAAAEGVIDWDRRLDHMQQHSGQHLLSALCARELQAPTVSFHLGDVTSNIDLAGGAPSAEALDRVELLANQIIAEDRPVTVRTASRAEAEALLAAGQLRKLPERAGSIRLVEIANCDLNACGGTHVGSTGQIGGLWLRGTEKISRGVRVSFVCGLRAVQLGRSDRGVLRQATDALSVGAADLPAAIGRLQAEAKAAAREGQRLREELAAIEGARLAATAQEQAGLRLVEAVCADRDRDFVRLLASRTAAAAPRMVAILSSSERDTARVVLARSRDLTFNCGALMKEALAERGLRGGGSPDLAQGDVSAGAAADLRAALAARVRGLGA